MSSCSLGSTATIASEVCIGYGKQEDAVNPSWDKIIRTFMSSKRVWESLATGARAVRLQRDAIKPAGLLRGLPAIPDDLKGVGDLAGQATWEMKSTGCTCPHEARKGERLRWTLSRRRPTRCAISNRSPFTYVDTKSNGLAFLFFGWAYVLCMSFLEKQRIPMHYEDHEAPGEDFSGEGWFTVDLGSATGDELRWWRSLLSPGRGWRSTSLYHPVWATAYMGNVKFRVTAEVMPPTSLHPSPPSATQAVRFLSRFASMYNLESQAPLALSMALTLPLHNETWSIVQLPKPSLTRQDTQLASPSSIDLEYSNLSRYMALSSHPNFLSSALWGIFWEPRVDCNLVTPWFDAIIEVVRPLINGGDLEMLGHVLAPRRPNIAPLWYGIAACGPTKTLNSIIPFLEMLLTPVPWRPIPEVAAWTGSPQSFMDLSGSGPYVQEGGQVGRIDVWRLRHECWDLEPEGIVFRRAPMCPWPPFGSMPVDELDVSVRAHIRCGRHRWAYSRWTWVFEDGTELADETSVGGEGDQVGLDSLFDPDLPDTALAMPGYASTSTASEIAIGDIFRWAATEMEASGRDIYTHPWVQALEDLKMGWDDESDTGSAASQSLHYSFERVEDWVKKC